MQALIRTAEVTGDPAGPLLQGLAGLLDAMQAMTCNVGTQIAAARQPISKDDLNDLVRRAVYQMDHSLSVRAVSLQRGIVAGAVAAAIALIAIGWLAAGWWRPRADISGMTCQDEANGGRACYVWVTPPPQQVAPQPRGRQ